MSSDDKCPLCGCDLGSKGGNQHLFRCGTNVMGDVVSFIGTVCLTTQVTRLRADKERLQGIVDLVPDDVLNWINDKQDIMARQAAEAAPKEDGVKPGIQETLDKVWEAGGKAWDGVDVEAAIAELRGYGNPPQGQGDT